MCGDFKRLLLSLIHLCPVVNLPIYHIQWQCGIPASGGGRIDKVKSNTGKIGTVDHACNHGTWESEAGGLL